MSDPSIGLRKHIWITQRLQPWPYLGAEHIRHCNDPRINRVLFRQPTNAPFQNEVLQNLVSETSKDHKPSPYKFHVSSTIIQHTPSTHPSPGPAESRSKEVASSGLSNGRRGMHSAAGAFWDDKKDGMWSYKYEGNAQQGFDVVVSVVWVSRS